MYLAKKNVKTDSGIYSCKSPLLLLAGLTWSCHVLQQFLYLVTAQLAQQGIDLLVREGGARGGRLAGGAIQLPWGLQGGHGGRGIWKHQVRYSSLKLDRLAADLCWDLKIFSVLVRRLQNLPPLQELDSWGTTNKKHQTFPKNGHMGSFFLDFSETIIHKELKFFVVAFSASKRLF